MFLFICVLLSSCRRKLPKLSARFAAFSTRGFSFGVGVVKTMGSGPVIGLCWQDGQDLTKEDMKVGAREGGRKGVS